MLKKISTAVAFIASCNCFAQSLSTKQPRPEKNPLKGIFAGVNYMNLTDLRLSSTFATSRGNDSSSYEGIYHVGYLGAAVGYNQTPSYGPGYQLAVRYFQGLNPVETGGRKDQVWIPEADVTFGWSQNFSIYAGVNGAFITSSQEGTTDTVVDPDIGGQIGISGRFFRNLSVTLGYSLLRYQMKVEDRQDRFSSRLEVQHGGFATTVAYVF